MAFDKTFYRGCAAGAVGLLIVLFIVTLIVAYSGAYNVAASEDHTAFVRWTLDTTMRNAVEDRASDIDAPASFTAEAIAAGAVEYQAMCEHCHAGPGVERAQWAEGLLPQPPHLTEAAAMWEPNEVFWLVKHGVKMSAMPAFGETHGDEAIWNIAAFVSQLPGMTEETYRGYAAQGAHSHSH